MIRKRILIIDDEEHILTMLRINMKTQGYDCMTALTGEEGLRLSREYQPDLILLDVMLPGIDGVEVCRRLKKDDFLKRIPVLMLSAKSQGKDKITGLEGGADDYITKPFSLKELFLRIKAALRQVDILTAESQQVLSAGSLILNNELYEATSGLNKIEVTLTEFRILLLLMKNKGTAVSRETLITEILERESSEGGRTLDVHIRNLRKKLQAAGVSGAAIETIRGTGYVIREHG